MNQISLFDLLAPPVEARAPDSALEGIPPEVIALFERLALDIARQKFKQYSADAILHRIRWHFHIEKGDREFKANNNWTASLARWFLRKHPELPDFFETRRSPHSDEA